MNNNSTFNSNFQNETLYINYCINNVLMQLNTILPAKIISVSGQFATIETLLIPKGLNQPSPNPIQISGVPLGQIVGGNAGIIIDYQPNDVVLCGAVQRDISSMRNTWTGGVAPSNRKFNLSDVVVICKLSNTLPTTYVKVTDAGGVEIKCSGSQPVSITTTGNVTANCNNAIITASGNVTANCVNANVTATGQATITAPTINLTGNVIISGSLTCATAVVGGKDFATHTHGHGTYATPTGGGAVGGDSGIVN